MVRSQVIYTPSSARDRVTIRVTLRQVFTDRISTLRQVTHLACDRLHSSKMSLIGSLARSKLSLHVATAVVYDEINTSLQKRKKGIPQVTPSHQHTWNLPHTEKRALEQFHITQCGCVRGLSRYAACDTCPERGDRRGSPTRLCVSSEAM